MLIGTVGPYRGDMLAGKPTAADDDAETGNDADDDDDNDDDDDDDVVTDADTGKLRCVATPLGPNKGPNMFTCPICLG